MSNETLKILIIDDDEINNFIATKLIDRIEPPAVVSTCLNGKEGMDFLESNIGNTEKLPDIILLDINMPVMNGWQFLDAFDKIKDRMGKDIHINMLSSSVYNDDITKSQTYSTVRKFISKPLTTDKIKEIYSNLGY
ncbi:response regulator receiver protein [Pseudopedobacter saltans DSM 12145]|uniref:Response regulator receiver protein n=1 Tax=Pseudopedobacter saltans (strain ATCC 51119 / DSM 12145 / JCM 21818 / CCUG 39354 / LMG 10337 / NBRC 100064 / NCIMB 13643) TaxID=762903 RepID=F0SDZ1_PSESL|nr:response regulator [Pseudopedobacter saltans]ADY52917.1 response regulator receiver protein [Pseudopedobacter saltans DSM 12145]